MRILSSAIALLLLTACAPAQPAPDPHVSYLTTMGFTDVQIDRTSSFICFVKYDGRDLEQTGGHAFAAVDGKEHVAGNVCVGASYAGVDLPNSFTILRRWT